jgi:hypothetical protein
MGLDGGASKEHDMKINELVESAKDSLTVTRVYGEPYEKNGVTVIPAASVAGGGGGGGGHDNDGQEGEGGGFGLSAKPRACTSCPGMACVGGRRSMSTGWSGRWSCWSGS